jgi:ribosomal protein L34
MSVSVDWKPERAVQAKIRDKKKNDGYPDRLKTRKGRSMQKLRIMTSNCISQHSPLGASSRQKNLRFKASANQRLRTGAFKVVRKYNSYMCSMYLPIYLPFSKFFKDPWSHAIGRPPLNSSNSSLCPFIWNSHLFYLQNFFYFWWQYLKQKFSKYKTFLTFFEKCEQQTLSLNSWVVETYINIRLENGYIPEEKHG